MKMLLLTLGMCLVINRTELMLLVEVGMLRGLRVGAYTTTSVPAGTLRVRDAAGALSVSTRCEAGQRLLVVPDQLRGGYSATVE